MQENSRSRWLDGYASAPPWGIDLLLTNACNLRCSYCPIWGDDAVVPSPSAMMPFEKAIDLIDDVATFKPMIRLFGGEPFLHPQWLDVVLRARQRGMHCTAVTNGTRLERDADAIVRSGMLAVGISIDTEAEVNDALRGEDTFALVRRGVTALAAAKRRAGSDTPRIEIYTTVHETSFDRLVAWAEELSSWEIDTLRLQHLIWFSTQQLSRSVDLLHTAIGEPHFFRSEEKSYARDQLPRIDLEILAAELAALRARSWPFRIESHPELSGEEMKRYYGLQEFERSERRECTTMEAYAFVDPMGRLYPCMTLEMGSVFEQPFLEVWNGERFRAFRRLIRKEKRLPLCHRCPDQ
jgi:MoaA/NifB/PqqE/SkfB family radical SAM enzyme